MHSSATWRPRYLLRPSSNFPPLKNGCALQALADEGQSSHLPSACILACILVRHKLAPVRPQCVILQQSRKFNVGSPHQCPILNCCPERGFFRWLHVQRSKPSDELATRKQAVFLTEVVLCLFRLSSVSALGLSLCQRFSLSAGDLTNLWESFAINHDGSKFEMSSWGGFESEVVKAKSSVSMNSNVMSTPSSRRASSSRSNSSSIVTPRSVPRR